MGSIKYQARLDGLRFIAIFMVLVEHFAHYIGKHISAGFYGVNLFFVISGFLITSILIKDSTGSFKELYLQFLGRRALRIFPIYYLSIFLIWFFKIGSYDKDIFYLLTYTYNYHLVNMNNWSSIYSLFWSLSVEEQFYIFFPVIVLLLRKRLNVLTIICGIILLAAVSQILFNFFSLGKYNYVGIVSNMWPLTIGAVGALLMKREIKGNVIFSNIYVEIFVIAALVTVIAFGTWSVKILICPLLNIFIVLKAYHFGFSISGINYFLSNKHIIKTGRISYGIYVYHGFINYYFTVYVFDVFWAKIPFDTIGVFSKLEYHSWILKLPLYTMLSIIVASISFKLIESPILKLKDLLFPVK